MVPSEGAAAAKERSPLVLRIEFTTVLGDNVTEEYVFIGAREDCATLFGKPFLLIQITNKNALSSNKSKC